MKSATILVIDDEESVRQALKRVLEDAGYQVAEAGNGRQGLELFRATPADLVITDIEMPEMDGLVLILELTRAFLNVKVIAVSGLASNELQAAKLLGARSTFSKPLDLPVLLRAIAYELKH
ncbi:MAG: response regulator [Nitrospira sp.]|nr:response regulator [Nitrospira sp.]